MRFWSSGPLANVDAASSLLCEIHRGVAEGSLFQWGIAEQGTVIGTFTLYRIDSIHRRAEIIGFALRRSAWGRGMAREAVRRGIEFAFNELDLHRIEADADPRNSGSIALLEALGFRNEGLLRERYFVNGEIQDAQYFGLLRREYVPRSPPEPRDGRAVVAPY